MDQNLEKINIQAMLWNILPNGFRLIANSFRILPRYFSWFFRKNGRSHFSEVVSPYKDKYNNCRCVVIGNGPSLNKMDLSVLKDEFTFGLNRIYLLFEEWGFQTTFLVSVNRFVITQFYEDLVGLEMLKFFNWAYLPHRYADSSTVFFMPKPSYQGNGNIINGYYPIGGTVTNVALEIAFFMGFSEVILIGVDHMYKGKGVGGYAIKAKDQDNNHFSDNYFGPGVVWQLPNYTVMEQGYEKMKDLFGSNSRRIVDATVDGKLNVFPKVNFLNYLSDSNYINKKNF